MNRRKSIFFLLLSTILPSLLCADEVYYRVICETSVYEIGYSPSSKSRFGKIATGTRVRMATNFVKGAQGMYGHFYVTNDSFDGGYYIYANDLVPSGTIDTFESCLLTQFSGPHQRRWVDSTLLDMLEIQDREHFLKYNIFFTERYDPANSTDPFGRVEWYDYLADDVSASSMVFFLISNSCIKSDIEILYLTRIIKNDHGYILTCGTTENIWEPIYNELGHDWTPVIDKESNFTMTLKIDGDFMDIYLEDSPKIFATYQLVDQKTIEQIVNLLRTETCDLKKVTWPIRASDLGGTGLIYRTVDRLKLRKSENRSSDVIKTLDIGAGMVLLSKGSEETIDGITSNWVQVKTKTGETGWCFGGYLDPRP